MNPSDERGVMAYMAFRLSHAMFQRPPSELDGGQQRRLAASVQRQAMIESRVLSADEARGVHVPEVTVDEAVGQLRERYEDEASFDAAVAAQGFDAAALREALARELRVEAVLDKVSSRSATVSELDVQLHYQLRQSDFSRPERRRVSHILITVNDDFPENTRERALARISAIRQRLLKKAGRFSEQAMKHSECPTAMNGGLLGDYTRGQLFPELDAALFEMQPGELSEPIESELGFHLLRCEDVRPAGVAALPEVSGAIRESIEARRKRLCQREWLKELLGGEMPQPA
ncbi:MAG: nitrogen fixation protein NifM [Rhodocyclaceae bacterium]|nr:nitrogen fixation protein NifM [Rhodocyclaceae bacterium]